MDTDPASALSPDPWRPLRFGWRVALVLVHLVVAILICATVVSWKRDAVMRNGHEPFTHRVQRAWSRHLLRIFGLRAIRFGEPTSDPALFVANHTSWLDIEAMHTQRAACFVAKAEIKHWPLVGWLAASAGTIFHHRGNNGSLNHVMQTMVERMRAGRSVAVFPEGGTSHDGATGVFHARIFQTALDAQAPVQPVALRFTRNGQRVLDRGFRDGESFVQNIVRLLGAPPLDFEIHFLDVVPPSPNARRHMAELARARIAAVLDTDSSNKPHA
jgi:1-acyl-sn-glycerol-3-phosphate acyltransferase